MDNSVTVSVKMPSRLKQRIDTLARKGLISRNKWIVRTLTRETGLKGVNANRSASQDG